MSLAVASPGVSVAPSLASAHPSGAYWARFLMKQSSGNIEDSSGNAHTAIIEADLVTAGTAWSANAGVFTCLSDAAGGNGGANIPNAMIDIDLRTYSTVWFARVLIPSSVTAAEVIMGYGASSVSGLRMNKRATGHELQIQINRGSGQGYGLANGLALNDDAFHTIAMGIDGPANLAYSWVDGAIQLSAEPLTAAGTDSGLPATANFAFGHEGLTGTTIPAQFDVVQIFRFLGNLPARLAAGIAFLQANRYDWMPASIWP